MKGLVTTRDGAERARGGEKVEGTRVAGGRDRLAQGLRASVGFLPKRRRAQQHPPPLPAAGGGQPPPHLPLVGISVPTGDFHSSTHTGSRAGPRGALGTGRDPEREAGPGQQVRSDGQGAGMGTAHDTPHFSQGL